MMNPCELYNATASASKRKALPEERICLATGFEMAHGLAEKAANWSGKSWETSGNNRELATLHLEMLRDQRNVKDHNLEAITRRSLCKDMSECTKVCGM